MMAVSGTQELHTVRGAMPVACVSVSVACVSVSVAGVSTLVACVFTSVACVSVFLFLARSRGHEGADSLFRLRLQRL